MKWLLLLLCLSASAQPFNAVTGLPFLAPNAIASAPPDIPTSVGILRYRWVAADAATNINTTNNNVTNWFDRVQGFTLSMANTTNQPTNSVSGLRFDGAQVMTNAGYTFPIGAGSTGTLWITFTFENAASFPAIIHNGGGSFKGITIDTGSKPRYINTGSEVIASALPSSTLIDLCIVVTNTGAYICYTNGLFSANFSDSPVSLSSLGSFTIANPAVDPFKGYIREYLVFSNILSSSGVSNLHYYRTNTYGGSP